MIDGLLEEIWIVIGNPEMKMVGVIQRFPKVEDASGTRRAAGAIAGDTSKVHDDIA